MRTQRPSGGRSLVTPLRSVFLFLSCAVLFVIARGDVESANAGTTCGSDAPSLVLNAHPTVALEVKQIGGRGVRAGRLTLLKLTVAENGKPLQLRHLGVFRDGQFMHVTVLSTDLATVGHAMTRAKKATRVYESANGTIGWAHPDAHAADEIVFSFPYVGWYLITAVVPYRPDGALNGAVYRLLLGARVFVAPEVAASKTPTGDGHVVPIAGRGVAPEKALGDRFMHVMPPHEQSSSYVLLASPGFDPPSDGGMSNEQSKFRAVGHTDFTVHGRLDIPPRKLPTGDPVLVEACIMPPDDIRDSLYLLDEPEQAADEDVEAEGEAEGDGEGASATAVPASESANATDTSTSRESNATSAKAHHRHVTAPMQKSPLPVPGPNITQRQRDLRSVRHSRSLLAVADDADLLARVRRWEATREAFRGTAKLLVVSEHSETVSIMSQSLSGRKSGTGGLGMAAMALSALSNSLGGGKVDDGKASADANGKPALSSNASASVGSLKAENGASDALPFVAVDDDDTVVHGEMAEERTHAHAADGISSGGLSLDVNEMPLNNIIPGALQSASEETRGGECVGFTVCFASPGAFRLILEARDPERNVLVAAFDVRTEESNAIVAEGTLIDAHARLVLSPGAFVVSFASLGGLMIALSVTIARRRLVQRSERQARVIRLLRNGFFILLWYIFSTALTFYNKWFLSKGNFKCPLVMTVLHMVVCYSLSRACIVLWPSLRGEPVDRHTFLRRVVPAGVSGALDIGLSNFSLLFITVTLYTICKSSLPFWAFVGSIALGLERARLARVIPMVTVCVGVVLGAMHDGHGHQHTAQSSFESVQSFSPFGLFLVLSAAFAGGLRLPYMQLLMQRGGGNLAPPSAFKTVLPSHIPHVRGVVTAYDGTSRPLLDRKYSGPDPRGDRKDADSVHHSSIIASVEQRLVRRTSDTQEHEGNDEEVKVHGDAPHAEHTPPAATPATARRHPVTTLYYVAPVMAAVLFPLAVAMERGAVLQFYESGLLWRNVVLSMVGGVLAFAMSLSAFHVVHRTSGITLSLAGVVKEVLTIVLSIAIYGDRLSLLNYFGLALSLGGIVAFHLAEEHH